MQAPTPALVLQVHHFRDETHLLQGGLSKYFNNHLFSDIVVVPPDGRRLHCHQLVLSAGSTRFAAMLESGGPAWDQCWMLPCPGV